MSRIAIVDADLIGRNKHRFPNLVCMKISRYHKEHGDDVELVTEWGSFSQYDEVYISKVFTDTPVPGWLNDFVCGSDSAILRSPEMEADLLTVLPPPSKYLQNSCGRYWVLLR